MFNNFTNYDTFPEKCQKAAGRDVKGNYDLITYDVQTSDFLHIAVKSIGKPQHTPRSEIRYQSSRSESIDRRSNRSMSIDRRPNRSQAVDQQFNKTVSIVKQNCIHILNRRKYLFVIKQKNQFD